MATKPTYEELAIALDALLPIADHGASDMSAAADDLYDDPDAQERQTEAVEKAWTAIETGRALLARIQPERLTA